MSMRQSAVVWIKSSASTALFVFVSLVVSAQPTPPLASADMRCGEPVALQDGWPIARPEAAGFDGARLCGIAERFSAADANVHGIVVVRHGKLVYERYFAGHDSPWGGAEGQYEFSATTRHDMRSISKSVTSLLVGIAIDRKLISSVDMPVLEFFPEYASSRPPGWDRITLRHLLTMSSGMEWNENLPWNPKNNEWHLLHDRDPLRYVLGRPIALPPGILWNYNGGSTELLGRIVEKASGKPFDVFAREVLFEPLGIHDWEWKTSTHGTISYWGGLRIRPRDAAKIGQLLLDKGRWDGRQIVSPEWISESIRPRFQAIGYFGGLFFYGYQWWMGRTLVEERDVKWIAGIGRGGQRLFVIPDLDVVVVTTSGGYSSPRQSDAPLELLHNFVVPAVRDLRVRKGDSK